MTFDEIRQLLALASAYDPRNSPTNPHERNAKAHAWHLALTDIPYEPARTAVIAHYRSSNDTLMPADIIRRLTPAAATNPGILTQQPPCDTCGLQPGHRRHDGDGHTYRPAFPEPRPAELDIAPAVDWYRELRQARDDH